MRIIGFLKNNYEKGNYFIDCFVFLSYIVPVIYEDKVQINETSENIREFREAPKMPRRYMCEAYSKAYA